MQVSRKGKPRYRRAENGTKVTGDSEEGVRAKKFSEMQDVAKFMNYTYNLPNVRRAIEQYSLGGGTWQYPSPLDVTEKITAPRPRRADLDFAFDENSVGPIPESIYHMETAYAPQPSWQSDITLAEAKRLYEQEEPPPESDRAARRRWEKGREHYMDMMGIRGDHRPEFYKDRNWYEATEEQHIIDQLKEMFPNEPEETFQSIEGLSSLMARRASNELTMLQNFDMVEPYREGSLGYTIMEPQGSRSIWPLAMGLNHIQKRGRPVLRMREDADRQVGAHELSHVIDFESNQQAKSFRDRISHDAYNSNSLLDFAAEGGEDYILSPTEIRSRLMGLRWNMYHNKIKDPSETYTAEDVAKIASTENKGATDLHRLRMIYDDETIAELLNNAY